MKASDAKKLGKKRWLGSAFYFMLCYTVLLLFIFLMIVINYGENWTEFFAQHYSQLLTLVVGALLLFGIVYYYYYFEDKDFFAHGSNIFLVFSIITISVVICVLFGKYINIYIRPSCMLALVCVFLFNRRQSILLNFVFSMLMFLLDVYTGLYEAYAADGSYLSLILSFMCGTLAVFAASKVRTRGGLLLTGCASAAPTMVIVFLLKLPTVYELKWIKLLSACGFSVLGCIMSSMFALSLLPVFEFAFNKLTVFRLRELTSTNAPILVRLQKEAPGTFNHSLIVAQLAETCAVAIGENAELARAAAYYHDVGKLKQPDCFTENQTDYNVHDELMPELSADIIRSHAKDGYDLLTAARLPAIIADVAREHHGTLPIKYFYNKAMRLSGEDVDVLDFSYLGPTPKTRIAAIVMIADAAEASTRALQNRNPESVERVVRGIIEERMDLDQFDDCNITIRDLTTIRMTLVEALSGVHHHRVEYPAIRFNRAKQAVKDESENDK